jgi:hypothetical protein
MIIGGIEMIRNLKTDIYNYVNNELKKHRTKKMKKEKMEELFEKYKNNELSPYGVELLNTLACHLNYMVYGVRNEAELIKMEE